MLVISRDFKDISHKVNKVGGISKGQRKVKNRQKMEATENKIVFKIDRANDQRNERREKRKRYAY